MDFFAVILVTITAVTICGICLFIFVCALQPKFLSKLHGKASRTYHDSDSNASSNENEDRISVKSLDEVIKSSEPTAEDSLTSPKSNGRDKKAYLKALEQSIRTGRRIHDEDDDNNNNDENQSHSNPLNYLTHFINKYIRRKTTDNTES